MRFIKQIWPFLLLASLPFERIPSYDLAILGHSVTVRSGLIIGVVGIALFGWITAKNLKLNFKEPETWLVSYLVVALLSILFTLNLPRSLIAATATLIVLGTSLVVAQVFEKVALEKVYITLFIASVVVSIIGLYQFFGDAFGLPRSLTGLREIYTKQVFGFPRVQSVSLEPLFFANFLIIPILLTVGLLYTKKISGPKYWLGLFLFTLTLGLTLSRGGYWATAGGLIIVVVALRKLGSLKRVAALSATMLLGVASAVLMIYVTAQITGGGNKGDAAVSNYVHQSKKVSSAQSADSDRVVNRKLALEAFAERPVIGNGLGAFGTYAQRNDPVFYASTDAATVNNEYLEILAETGLLGFISLAGFVITLMISGINALNKTTDTNVKAWIGSLLAICVAFGIQYNSFSTLYIMQIWVMIGILMALVANANSSNSSKSKA